MAQYPSEPLEKRSYNAFILNKNIDVILLVKLQCCFIPSNTFSSSPHSPPLSCLPYAESEAGRRSSRLSSIFSSRRTSRPSVSNATSLLDNEAALPSPLPTSPSQTNVPTWPSKKKSLVSLVRSTRQSKASSVIHRNGETIIIKGGKIVCVRRESDSVTSPTHGPSRPLLDMANRVADSSKTVVCGIALKAAESDQREENCNMGMSNSEQILNTSRNKSETETSFEEMDLEMAGLDDSIVFENAESDDFHDENVPVQKVDEVNENKPSNGEKQNQGDIPKKCTWMTPIIEVQDSDEESQPSVEGTVDPSSSALSKMVLSIASNTDVLIGMPLSHQTKNALTKSDIDLSAPPVPVNNTNLGTPLARSTENISPRRHFKRLPSLEYLDPPVRILHTQSNRSNRRPTAVHRSPRLKPKSPLLKPRNLH